MSVARQFDDAREASVERRNEGGSFGVGRQRDPRHRPSHDLPRSGSFRILRAVGEGRQVLHHQAVSAGQRRCIRNVRLGGVRFARLSRDGGTLGFQTGEPVLDRRNDHAFLDRLHETGDAALNVGDPTREFRASGIRSRGEFAQLRLHLRHGVGDGVRLQQPVP
ncbi:hypothetical protein [Azospirillum argentinense]